MAGSGLWEVSTITRPPALRETAAESLLGWSKGESLLFLRFILTDKRKLPTLSAPERPEQLSTPTPTFWWMHLRTPGYSVKLSLGFPKVTRWLLLNQNRCSSWGVSERMQREAAACLVRPTSLQGPGLDPETCRCCSFQMGKEGHFSRTDCGPESAPGLLCKLCD